MSPRFCYQKWYEIFFSSVTLLGEYALSQSHRITFPAECHALVILFNVPVLGILEPFRISTPITSIFKTTFLAQFPRVSFSRLHIRFFPPLFVLHQKAGNISHWLATSCVARLIVTVYLFLPRTPNTCNKRKCIIIPHKEVDFHCRCLWKLRLVGIDVLRVVTTISRAVLSLYRRVTRAVLMEDIFKAVLFPIIRSGYLLNDSSRWGTDRSLPSAHHSLL